MFEKVENQSYKQVNNKKRTKKLHLSSVIARQIVDKFGLSATAVTFYGGQIKMVYLY